MARGPYRRRPSWRRRPVRAGAIIARRAGGRLQGVGSGGNPRRPGARGASDSERVLGRTSLEVVRRRRDPTWCQTLRDRLRELGETDQERATLLRRSVDLPPGVLDSDDAKAAIGRAASGQRLWPLVSVGKGDAKALVSAIKLDGSPPKDGDVEGWKHVAAVLANAMRQRETHARWDAFARSVGIPDGGQRSTAIEFCRSMLAACDAARAQSELLSSVVAKAFNLEALANNPSLCAALAAQIRAAASAARLATVDKERRRVRSLFESKEIVPPRSFSNCSTR